MARQIAVWVANADSLIARRRIVGATACESTMRPPSCRDPASRAGILRQSTTLNGSAVTRDEDAEPQIRIPPAHRLVEVPKHRRPDGAADTLPGRDQADREAAAVLEPAHHVDAQRTVDGRIAEQPDHQAVGEVQLPPRVDRADEHRAGADHGQAEQGHRSRSGAVEPVAHGDAADSGAGEEQRVGEGRHGARPVEIARHLLEVHHQQEHSAVGGHHQVGGDNEHCDADGTPLRSRVGFARASHLGTQLSGSLCRLEIHQFHTLGQAPGHPRPGQAS